MLGPASLTVQVADNDVAPQVEISFNHAEVNEGNDLILSITRIGDDRNPLEIEVTDGPVDAQKYEVVVMEAGQSLLNFVYNHPDDDRKGPDVEYKATLHSGSPELWTPTGQTTVTGVILDDDPYRVGVDAGTLRKDEGEILYYRVFHDGHSADLLQVQVQHSQTGSAVDDFHLGPQNQAIYPGNSGITRGYPSKANDGSDGDAEFTIEVLPSADYEIDPNFAKATITVRDRDPLPVLEFPPSVQHFNEGIGNAEVPVDLTSLLPVLRTVTVDYEIIEGNHTDGADIVESSGTLEFPAGTTQALIEVSVIQDLIAEGDEQFTVVLSNPVNATLQDGQTTLSSVVIINDDEPKVSVEAATTAVTEGDDIILTLTRIGDITGELTAWLRVEEHRDSVSITYPSVTFAPNSPTAQYTISTTDDNEDGGNYKFNVMVGDPVSVGGTSTYRADYAITEVTVRDDELPRITLIPVSERGEPLGQYLLDDITFFLPAAATEGDTLYFSLRRGNPGPAIMVNLEVTGAGNFVTGTLPTTATIAEDQTNLMIAIATEDDTTIEDHAILTITLKDGTGYVPSDDFRATRAIYDNDAELPVLSIDARRPWVNEGEDVVFTITRSGGSGNGLSANVRVLYGRAEPHFLGGIIEKIENVSPAFIAGQDTVNITLTTDDDDKNYGDATITAVIMPGDYSIAAQAEHGSQAAIDLQSDAQVWVQDDDRPTVTLSPPTAVYDEDELLEVTLSRAGDTTPHLRTDAMLTITRKHPVERTTTHRSYPLKFLPGENDVARVFGYSGRVEALGATGRLWLVPDYCPDGSAECGRISVPHYCPDNPGINSGQCLRDPQYLRGSAYEQTFTIHSDFMGVRIEADQPTVAEGTAVTFTLHRHGGKPVNLAKTLEVQLQVTQEGDYLLGPAPLTVTFQPGSTTATLSIPTINDTVDEADGSITATLLPPYQCTDDQHCYEIGEYEGTPWEVTSVNTAVTDDDYVLPEVSVADVIARENDGTMEFTVSLDRANNEEASSVDWATREDGTTEAATSGTDFTAASGTLNFAVGETEKTVTVTLLDDDMDENHETFNIVLSNPSNLTLGTSIATGTILDDEQASIVLFTTPHRDRVEEGDNLVLKIKRLFPLDPGQTVNSDDPCYGSNDISGCFTDDPDPAQANVSLDVIVRVTQEGNVISGPAPTTVTFQPGSIYTYLTIPTDDDAIVEPDGEVKAEILNGPGYSPLFLSQAQHADDTLPTVLRTVYDNDLTFSVDDAQNAENAGTLDFTVSLNAPAPRRVTVDVTTMDGDATSHGSVTATSLGQDFTAGAQTLTFLKGEQTKTFSVALLDDSIQERPETFSVHLSNQPQFSPLADDTGVGTILDDEQPMVVSVRRAYSIVEEDQAGPVKFKVALSHPDTVASERNVAVAWRVVAGSATEGDDYLPAGGMYNFPVGTTSDFLLVTLKDDNLFEEELETFTVELIPQGTRLATLSTTDASFEASIRDNETLTAAITADSDTVAEGELAVFRVTLTGSITTEITNVNFEELGDARTVEDYGTPFGLLSFPPGDSTGRMGTLQIPAGQSSGTITYPILNDSVEEDDETLEVEVFRASSGPREVPVSPTQSSASSTILDQGALNVSIEAVPSVDEGAAAAFTVYLSKIDQQGRLSGVVDAAAGAGADRCRDRRARH